ncbi:aspartate dehydrogenase [Acidisphaera sp. L21]|uniref:aspartate dehydrogenase n=1 Tax=Acidisphaera sp. L21 TaxID=1641851 RepID=UPI00131DBC97|nr:aspartate dehydrogenase [Acidisphaera sp. L21]
MSQIHAAPPLRIAIAGFGAIGRTVAARLLAGIPGLQLTAVGVRGVAKARATLPSDVEVTDVASLAQHADIIVECAPAAVLPGIAEPALRAGRTVVVLSCGALLEQMYLVELARAHGGRIMVPTGALLGLDAVAAAAEGEIHSIRMITRKPPRGLVGAPYLIEHGIELEGLTAPLRVFEGTAREAARGFPANLNVAVALSLAGIGPDRTRLEIWADPTVTRNTHTIELDADSARLSVKIENIPSENPKTGRITALSVIALLRKLRSPLAIGT